MRKNILSNKLAVLGMGAAVMLGHETERVDSTAIQEQTDTIDSLVRKSIETSPTLDEAAESIPLHITLYESNQQVQEVELGAQLKNVIKNGFRRICERLDISEEECARILTTNNEIDVNIIYDNTRTYVRGRMNDGAINVYTNSLDSEEFKHVFLHEFIHYLHSPIPDPWNDPPFRKVLEEGSTTILASFGVQYNNDIPPIYASYAFITSLLGSDFIKLRLTHPEKFFNLRNVYSLNSGLETLKQYLERNFARMNLNLSEETTNYILQIIMNSSHLELGDADYYQNSVRTILDRVRADNRNLTRNEIYAIIRHNCLYLDLCTSAQSR